MEENAREAMKELFDFANKALIEVMKSLRAKFPDDSYSHKVLRQLIDNKIEFLKIQDEFGDHRGHPLIHQIIRNELNRGGEFIHDIEAAFDWAERVGPLVDEGYEGQVEKSRKIREEDERAMRHEG